MEVETTHDVLRCANCGRGPRDDENPDDEWRAGSDGLGELHVFCPECWQREFGDDAPNRNAGPVLES